MPVIQVRDVPDDVAEILAQTAAAEHKSLSAYLRDLMTTAARAEQRRQQTAAAHQRVKEIQARMKGPRPTIEDGVKAVREVRDEYVRGDAP
jgi:plasmid stability protein